MINLFRFKHLRDINMSYSQHFLFAMDLSNKLFKGSIQSLIHGIFPNFYETSTTDLMKEIDDKFKSHGNRKSTKLKQS